MEVLCWCCWKSEWCQGSNLWLVLTNTGLMNRSCCVCISRVIKNEPMLSPSESLLLVSSNSRRGDNRSQTCCFTRHINATGHSWYRVSHTGRLTHSSRSSSQAGLCKLNLTAFQSKKLRSIFWFQITPLWYSENWRFLAWGSVNIFFSGLNLKRLTLTLVNQRNFLLGFQWMLIN